VDNHELGNSIKWKDVPSRPTPFLHYPDSPFYLRYVLVGTCQVHHADTWNKLNQGIQGCKFTVGMHLCDMETTLKILLIHFFESLQYMRYRAVHEVVDSRETDITTERQEEENLVDKEDIGCQKKHDCGALVTPWVFYIVPSHRNRLAPSGLAFSRCDYIVPNLQSNIDVLDCHRKIIFMITSNHPLEIHRGWVSQSLVQSSCGIGTLDLPLRKTLLVIGCSADKSKVLFFSWIIIMQAALMHSKFHIRCVL
jgi:hypothetical protein